MREGPEPCCAKCHISIIACECGRQPEGNVMSTKQTFVGLLTGKTGSIFGREIHPPQAEAVFDLMHRAGLRIVTPDELAPAGAIVLTEAQSKILADAESGPLEPVKAAPIPMLLHCPACGIQHIDKPDPENGWDNPPHRSHQCGSCGLIWRPADVATVGVEAIATHGNDDNLDLGEPSPMVEMREALTKTQRQAGAIVSAFIAHLKCIDDSLDDGIWPEVDDRALIDAWCEDIGIAKPQWPTPKPKAPEKPADQGGEA